MLSYGFRLITGLFTVFTVLNCSLDNSVQGNFADTSDTPPSVSPEAPPTVEIPPPAPSFLKISVNGVEIGDGHTCLLGYTEDVRCFGRGVEGQMGNGSNNPLNSISVEISGRKFIDVDSGGYHTCAIDEVNDLYCWGNGGLGQIGDGNNGNHSSPQPVDVSGIVGSTTFLKISSGENHSCAIADDGKAYCWGSGAFGRLGEGPTAGPNRNAPVEVSTTNVTGSTNFLEISAGFYHSCAVMDDGDVYCWGHGGSGRLGNGLTAHQDTPVKVLGGINFIQVSAGYHHSCGISNMKSVFCWGSGGNGVIGDGNTGSHTSPQAVDVSAISSSTTFENISSGQFSCAVADDGGAFCWGIGFSGQLGNGAASSESLPQQVDVSSMTGSKDFHTISVGATHACGISMDSKFYCWGASTAGELGDGANSSYNKPTIINHNW